MKKYGQVLGAVVGALLLAGCIGQERIESKAIGPTDGEARAMAKAQLEEQAQGHPMNYESISVKQVPVSGGGSVFQASGSAWVKK